MSKKEEMKTFVCEECGAEFLAKRPRKYCSESCRFKSTSRQAKERSLQDLKVHGWIRKNGELVPFESLTPEEHDEWERKACERLSQVLSEHFSNCSEEEWLRFVNGSGSEDEKKEAG